MGHLNWVTVVSYWLVFMGKDWVRWTRVNRKPMRFEVNVVDGGIDEHVVDVHLDVLDGGAAGSIQLRLGQEIRCRDDDLAADLGEMGFPEPRGGGVGVVPGSGHGLGGVRAGADFR